MSQLNACIQNWIKGFPEELAFWDDWCTKKGGDFAEDFLRRTSSSPAVDSLMASFLTQDDCVLDVGAGPISEFGNILQDVDAVEGRILLRACDPLADAYSRILKKNNIVPYCKTEFSLAERVDQVYCSDSFDLVHMRNALDHSFFPLSALKAMLNVLKINKYLVLRHAENEAEHEKYIGFHQWNISAEGGEKFIIWNNNIEYKSDDILKNFCDVTVIKDDCSRNIVIFIKKIKHHQVDVDEPLFLLDRELIKKCCEV